MFQENLITWWYLKEECTQHMLRSTHQTFFRGMITLHMLVVCCRIFENLRQVSVPINNKIYAFISAWLGGAGRELYISTSTTRNSFSACWSMPFFCTLLPLSPNWWVRHIQVL